MAGRYSNSKEQASFALFAILQGKTSANILKVGLKIN